jgi:uncharacterized protein YraI
MKHVLGASAVALLTSTSAYAATTAMATTDLNIRSGPGPMFEVVDVIASSDDVMVEGCLEDANWCQVEYNGTEGWAYGAYLTAKVETAEEPIVVVEARDQLEVQTVTYQETTGAAAASTTTGAVLGALIGGPAGAAAGAAIGAGLGIAVEPEPRTITYVTENPVDPIYLDGEVVVGARFPEGIEFNSIPDAEFDYVYVNGVPVLVDPQERRIVHIIR